MVDRILLSRFREGVVSIFGDKLIFAFIAGSVAKGKETSKSDIDMFIVVSKKDPVAMEKFKLWYVYLHKIFDLVSDVVYPGEVITVLELRNAFRIVSDTQPVKKISVKKLYDGVVWAGMLVGSSAGFVGNKNVFKEYNNQAHVICNTWITQLKIENPKNKTQDMLLKENIEYEF